MWRNILKFSLILAVLNISLALNEPKVITAVSYGYQLNVDTAPFVKLGDQLYYFSESKASWYSAQLACLRLGANLASINSSFEMNTISNYLLQNYTPDRWWWLSGSDVDVEGEFYWYGNGEKFSYVDWSTGQPDNNGGNEDCVHLWHQTTKYQMNDWGCHQQAYYICETKLPTTVQVTVF